MEFSSGWAGEREGGEGGEGGREREGGRGGREGGGRGREEMNDPSVCYINTASSNVSIAFHFPYYYYTCIYTYIINCIFLFLIFLLFSLQIIL